MKREGERNILILHPMIEGVEEKRAFFAGADDIEVVGLTQGPKVVQFRGEVGLVAPECIARAREAEKAGYQAIVLTCHADPNLYSLRDAVRIPVVGIMEAAMHFCAMLGHRFSIMVPTIEIKRWQEENVVKYGFESRVASIRAVPYRIPFAEVGKISRQKPIPEDIIGPALQECIKAITEDNATAITFGCGAFKWMTGELENRLKAQGFEITLVNPLSLGIEVARLLVKQKLTHSLAAYPASGKIW